jgi:two-component system LytT family sensor kinase
MNTSHLFGEPRPIILWRRLVWPWAAFWLLMLAVGIEESLWTGRLQFWRPRVDNGSAARAATVLVVVQIKRVNRFNRLLNQPLKWFLRSWASMPLLLVAHFTAMYALRFGIYALAGARHHRREPTPGTVTGR